MVHNGVPADRSFDPLRSDVFVRLASSFGVPVTLVVEEAPGLGRSWECNLFTSQKHPKTIIERLGSAHLEVIGNGLLQKVEGFSCTSYTSQKCLGPPFCQHLVDFQKKQLDDCKVSFGIVKCLKEILRQVISPMLSSDGERRRAAGVEYLRVASWGYSFFLCRSNLKIWQEPQGCCPGYRHAGACERFFEQNYVVCGQHFGSKTGAMSGLWFFLGDLEWMTSLSLV